MVNENLAPDEPGAVVEGSGRVEVVPTTWVDVVVADAAGGVVTDGASEVVDSVVDPPHAETTRIRTTDLASFRIIGAYASDDGRF